jgi:hypothetical protein
MRTSLAVFSLLFFLFFLSVSPAKADSLPQCQPGDMQNYEALGFMPDYATTPIGSDGCTLGNLEVGGFWLSGGGNVTATPVASGNEVGLYFSLSGLPSASLEFRVGEVAPAQVIFFSQGEEYSEIVEPGWAWESEVYDAILDEYMYGYALPSGEEEAELAWADPITGVEILFPDPADPPSDPPAPVPEPSSGELILVAIAALAVSKLARSEMIR